MYVGIDVGGTKTLAAVLDNDGNIIEHNRFPTPIDYDDFLSQLDATLTNFMHHDFIAGGAGVAARLDRHSGNIIRMGNLPWTEVPFQNDLEKICACPVAVENDAKVGGLSESILVKDKYHKALYIAIGTGIGVALYNEGKIDISIGDGGGRSLLLEYHGKLTPWEDFAGGRALAKLYGKPAREITDLKTWSTICRHIAQGLIQLIAISEPDVIIIGGGVGVYFERFGNILRDEVNQYAIPLIDMPDIIGAARPDEAVIYGCYELAKQVYGHE